jgi:hypothetical protein
LADPRTTLPLPGEPVEIRAGTRALIEGSPEEGMRVVRDATFVADLLWREWSEALEEAGMEYEGFLAIARGYAGELRLWVVGERPWEHCVSGLAGRVRRRLPARNCERALSATEVCR